LPLYDPSQGLVTPPSRYGTVLAMQTRGEVWPDESRKGLVTEGRLRLPTTVPWPRTMKAQALVAPTASEACSRGGAIELR